MLEMLDAFIGLIFVYLVLSLIVTTGMEFWTQFRGLRGKNLRVTIHRLLLSESGQEKDNALLHLFYAHPRMQALKESDKNDPSYIPKQTFIDVLMDLVTQRVVKRDNLSFAQFRKSPHKVERIIEMFELMERDGNYNKLGKTLKDFWTEADADLVQFQQRLETWFSDTEQRASGWFKRTVNVRLFILGLLVAMLTNADTIHMFRLLTADDGLRDTYVTKALEAYDKQDMTKALNLEQKCQDKNAATGADDSGCNPLDAVKFAATEIAPLMGWDKSTLDRFAPVSTLITTQKVMPGSDWLSIVPTLIGWLLTAVALSLGAPFWYDILQKVVRLRSSIRPGADAGASSVPGQAGTMSTQAAVVAAPVEPFDEENFDLFKANANNYNLVNAFWMVRFAELAYQEEKIIKARCKEWGLTADFYSTVADKVDTQYFIAYNNDTVIISFRGTEPGKMADVETDADFKLTQCLWDSELQVHTGFQRALQAVWEPLCANLSKIHKGRVVWIAGHSLGGALAALAAHRLDYEEQHGSVLKGLKLGGLYTCGQPRCGDYDFAQDLGERLGNRICRIVNNRDMVPLVPPPIGYAHAGSTLYINETGRLMFDPPFWYRVLDKMEVATDREKLAKSMQETVGDHSANRYLNLLAKKLNAAA